MIDWLWGSLLTPRHEKSRFKNVLAFGSLRFSRVSRKGLRPTRSFLRCTLRAMIYVYVLQSSFDDGLYIGMSGDLRRRFGEHQGGESRSTKDRRPWTLIYYEAYLEKADAEGRERFLKSGGGRKFLDSQLKNHFRRFPRREVK